ncbi:MAG: hypothetical protein ACI8XB_002931, partial [Patiriisocius sp.]
GPSLSRQPTSSPKLIHITQPFPRHPHFSFGNFTPVPIEFVAVT